MPTTFKYVKALTPLKLFNGAVWLEEEDIRKLPLEQFNLQEVQDAISNNELVEVNENDLPVDVTSPSLKLRGEWDPSNGQLPDFRRIGDTYLVNNNGIPPYDMLEPGMRVMFTSLNSFEILVGSGNTPPPPIIWSYQDADFAIEPGGRYIVDTTEGPVTGTLPTTLSNSFFFEIKDANLSGGFGTFPLFIARGAGATYTIMGDTSSFEVDIPSPILSFAYDSSNNNVVI